MYRLIQSKSPKSKQEICFCPRVPPSFWGFLGFPGDPSSQKVRCPVPDPVLEQGGAPQGLQLRAEGAPGKSRKKEENINVVLSSLFPGY